MNWKLITLTLVAISMGMPEAQARRGRGGSEEGRGRWLQQLNLNDQQMKQVESIRRQSKEEKQALREKIRDSRKKLTQALRESNTDKSYDTKLRALFQEVEQIRNQMHQARFESLLKVRKILTAEQRQKMKAPGRRMGREGKRGRGRRWRNGADN